MIIFRFSTIAVLKKKSNKPHLFKHWTTTKCLMQYTILFSHPGLWIPGWVPPAEASQEFCGPPSARCAGGLWTVRFPVLRSTVLPETHTSHWANSAGRRTISLHILRVSVKLSEGIIAEVRESLRDTDLDGDVHRVYHHSFVSGASLSGWRVASGVQNLQDSDDCKLVERRSAAVQNHPRTCRGGRVEQQQHIGIRDASGWVKRMSYLSS